MLQEIIRVFYKASEEGTGFAGLDVLILLRNILVEVLVENLPMLLPFLAVVHHTKTPTPAHPVQRQRYTPESNSNTRTNLRSWYCELSRNILTTSSRRGRMQLQQTLLQ